jgi:hypothetical protein
MYQPVMTLAQIGYLNNKKTTTTKCAQRIPKLRINMVDMTIYFLILLIFFIAVFFKFVILYCASLELVFIFYFMLLLMRL